MSGANGEATRGVGPGCAIQEEVKDVGRERRGDARSRPRLCDPVHRTSQASQTAVQQHGHFHDGMVMIEEFVRQTD